MAVNEHAVNFLCALFACYLSLQNHVNTKTYTNLFDFYRSFRFSFQFTNKFARRTENTV